MDMTTVYCRVLGVSFIDVSFAIARATAMGSSDVVIRLRSLDSILQYVSALIIKFTAHGKAFAARCHNTKLTTRMALSNFVSGWLNRLLMPDTYAGPVPACRYYCA